jgi:hypothetical protein
MKYYTQSRKRGISYIQYIQGKLTGVVIYCIGTAVYNMLLKEERAEG